MRLSDAYVICKGEIDEIESYKKELEKYIISMKNNTISSTEYAKQILEDQDNKKEFNKSYEMFCLYAKNIFGNIPYIYETLCPKKTECFAEKESCPKKPKGYTEKELLALSRVLTTDGYDIAVGKMKVFEEFYGRVKCIISLYETTYKQNEESIGLDIKIPGTDSITELKKYIESLEFVLTKCPFFQSNEESLKLRAVDNGSIWLIFEVAGFSAVVGSILMNNIAKFVKICIEIKKDLQDIRKKEQLLKQSDLEQKEMEEILKSLNKLYKIAVKNAINEMVRSTGRHLQDGDEQGRAEQSFERMVKLLDKGVQIHSAINSPKEVKELFDPIEKYYLSIDKKLEKIEEKLDIDTE